MSIIHTEHLTKTYHDSGVPVRALNGVNLDIEAGEFTAVVGPSGSGKSTLLHLIGGLDQPTEGKVIIDGIDIFTMTSGRLTDFRLHNIGFVFQAYNLIPVLTAKENIEFIMLLQSESKAERSARAMELLNAVGLGDRSGARPSELSGGQQQRVAVARALASRPKFVLADEPTANLDSKSAANLLDIMAALNRENKITFIFSTHDPRVIERAKRVVTLQDGQIMQPASRQNL